MDSSRRVITITLPMARPSPRALDSVLVVVLVALGVGVPFVLSALSGAITVAHNDDFAYRRAALGLYESGTLDLRSASTLSIGQVLYVQPFLWLSGGSLWAFAVAAGVLASIGIIAAYSLVRRLASRPIAVFSIVSLLVFPGVLADTASFMTDIPAMAAGLACLALAAKALHREGRRRWAFFVASVAVGCFAFSIREFCLAAPVAVLVVATASEPGSRLRYTGLWAAAVLTCGVVWLIGTSLPGRSPVPLEFSALGVARIRYAVATLALALSPALVLALARRWRYCLSPAFAVGAAGGIFVFQEEIATFLSKGTVSRVILGNVFGPIGGPGGVAAGYRPLLFASPYWDVLNALGILAAIVGLGLAAAVLATRLRSGEWRSPARVRASLATPKGLVVVFATLYGGGIAAVDTMSPLYDRYLWPLMIPLVCLLVMPPDEPSTVPARGRSLSWAAMTTTTVLVAALAVTSTTLMLNTYAFDSAGWRMGEKALDLGYPIETVDAGYAWVGYHADGVPDLTVPRNTPLPWYEDSWPSFHLCALVSASLLHRSDLHLEYADLEAYRLFLFAGPQGPLYLYSVRGEGCP